MWWGEKKIGKCCYLHIKKGFIVFEQQFNGSVHLEIREISNGSRCNGNCLYCFHISAFLNNRRTSSN